MMRKLAIKHKISISFSILAGALVVVVTFLTFWLSYNELKSRSQQTLVTAVNSVTIGLELGELQDIDLKLQRSVTSESADDGLSNVNSRNYSAGKVNTFSDLDFKKLEESKEVYSRVIEKDGDIVITSDLFETYQIDHNFEGFREYNYGPICLETLTKKSTEGVTVQVGKYCTVSAEDMKEIAMVIAAIGVTAIVITYLLGIGLAWYLLKPLEKAAKSTQQFIQDTNHELLTPISVALSTAESAIASENYEEGLKSLKDDLQDMHQTLNTITHKYLTTSTKSKNDNIKIKALINQIIKKDSETISKKGLKFDISGDVSIVSNDSFKLVLKNLIENAIYHSKPQTEIKISITKNSIEIKNLSLENWASKDLKQLLKRGTKGDLSNGKGIGLALVKELCDIEGWKLKIELEKGQFKTSLHFA